VSGTIPDPAAGPRFLMCPPDYFDVAYSINPWMDPDRKPDPGLAREQWEGLVAALRTAGAEVELLDPVEGLPDQVFTSDVGYVDRGRFIASRPRHAERRPEIDHAVAWFGDRGYEVMNLPEDEGAFLEAGEVVPFGAQVLASHGFRSTLDGLEALSNLIAEPVYPIELVEPRLYHLDAVFCPLDERRAMVAPDTWTEDARLVVGDLVPEPLALTMEEALTFCANAVVVGKVVIMPACPRRVGRALERWGLEPCVVLVSEFLKAGGSVHCLTLRIAG
jgi:N-dimethylarginine dimethylaminohydrolase